MNITVNNTEIELDIELFNNEINQNTFLYKTYKFIKENESSEKIIIDDSDFLNIFYFQLSKEKMLIIIILKIIL